MTQPTASPLSLDTPPRAGGPGDWIVLALFIVLVLGGGTLIGLLTTPGPWYEALEKPWFNPPDWLFGPAWSILYVLVAVAGWRTWRRGGGHAMRVWWVQLGINFLWSPIFFALHQIGLALIVVLAMLAAILLFIGAAWREGDHPSALLFAPYAAWVTFASLLNGAILWLN